MIVGCRVMVTQDPGKVLSIECEGWMQHSSLIFLILLFTKPNIEVSGWLYQTKTHFTHIIYQPFSRVSPPSFTLYASAQGHKVRRYTLIETDFLDIWKYQPNIEVCGWPYQTKIHITHIVYQENYQSIPPHFIH